MRISAPLFFNFRPWLRAVLQKAIPTPITIRAAPQ
jgi:hypothetical protein